MKAITEFSVFTLTKALQVKTALLADGKTPEEIQENLGQNLKMEGDKLNYLVQSLDVANENMTHLKRILVLKLDEGDKAPPKAVAGTEVHFVPEFFATGPAIAAATSSKGGGNRGGRGNQRGGKGGGGPKGSPWGLSPEEKALKNKKTPQPAT